MLEDTAASGNDDIVSWLPGGKSFRVHKPKEFVTTIMPRYFKQSHYKSFQRQLHIYGFSRIAKKGMPDTGAYSHPDFIQENKEAALTMQRVQNIKNRVSSALSSGSSDNPDSDSSRPSSPAGPSIDCKSPFPFKLYEMLEDAALHGYDDIVSWSPDGKAFKVHKPNEFAEQIMTRFFRQSKYKSFLRQLHIYSFKRINQKDPKLGGAYFHKDFVRGEKEATLQMTRTGKLKMATKDVPVAVHDDQKQQDSSSPNKVTVNEKKSTVSRLAFRLEPLPFSDPSAVGEKKISSSATEDWVLDVNRSLVNDKRRASMDLLRRFSVGLGNDDYILQAMNDSAPRGFNSNQGFYYDQGASQTNLAGYWGSSNSETNHGRFVERRTSIGLFRRFSMGVGNDNDILRLMNDDMFQYESSKVQTAATATWNRRLHDENPRVNGPDNLTTLYQRYASAMKKSEQTQKEIDDLDRKMGLNRSHSSTMRMSTNSRNQLRSMVHRMEQVVAI